MAAKPEEPSVEVRFIGLLFGVVSLCSGLLKVVGLSMQEDLIRRFGLPGWILPMAGGVEAIIGLLILNPRLMAWGALALALESIALGLLHMVSGVAAQMAIVYAVLCVGAVWLFLKERVHLQWPRTPHPR